MVDFLKLSGAVLLIGATSMLGFLGAQTLSERCRLLQAWLRILERLSTEINYQARRLPDIFAKIAVLTEDAKLASSFEHLAKQLDYGNGVTVVELWSEILRKQSRILKLNDLTILNELGNYLGTTDRQDQLEKLQLCQARLRQNLESANEQQQRQAGIYRYLGFAMGSIIVLWLI